MSNGQSGLKRRSSLSSDESSLNDVPMLVAVEKPNDSMVQRVPITIVTGFLGSGKTTLIQRLINDKKLNKRIAMILNDFGDSADIERGLLRATATSDGSEQPVEEWLELPNGCLCCSVKNSAVKAIESLLSKRGRFDHIFFETSGLADPGPIAQLFFLDDALGADIVLDGIVTIIDSTQFTNLLEDDTHDVFRRQISQADVILLNKMDMIWSSTDTGTVTSAVTSTITGAVTSTITSTITGSTPHENVDRARDELNETATSKTALVETDSGSGTLSTLTARIRDINSLARIIPCTRGQVQPSDIMFLRAFRVPETSDELLSASSDALAHATHDPRITTFCWDLPVKLTDDELTTLEKWLQSILWKDINIGTGTGTGTSNEASTGAASGFGIASPEIFRIKGFIRLQNGDCHFLQGLRDTYELINCTSSLDTESIKPKIIMIGRNLQSVERELSNIFQQNQHPSRQQFHSA